MHKVWIAIRSHQTEGLDAWPIFDKEEVERELKENSDDESFQIQGPFLIPVDYEND